jgi:hypothetical protein
MAKVCNFCVKNILDYQSKILCSSCKLYYHTRCVYSNLEIHDWLCFNCIGNIFPFNHYVDDDEFKFALFTFDNSVDYNNLLGLKLNPFNLDNTICNSFNDYGNFCNSDITNSCSYVFDGDQLPVYRDDDFSILHLNSSSMNKNVDGIHAFISNLNHTFSLISVSETWFLEDGSNPIEIENYTLLSAPRHARRSGGSAIYVHNSVPYQIRDDLKLCSVTHDNIDHSESIFIEIPFPNSKNIIVGNIYRAHRTDLDLFHTDLTHSLAKISAENKHSYISGDFNLDLLKYNYKNSVNNFLNTFYNHSMYPLIDRPTRITSTSATLLDNIFTNVISHKIKSGIFVTSLTDHYPVYQITNSISSKNARSQSLNYKSRLINANNIRKFYNHLSLIEWHFVTDIDCPETAYNTFLNKFTDIYNLNFPIEIIKITKSRRR